MKFLKLLILPIVIIFGSPSETFTQWQPPLWYLGLKNKSITSIGIYGDIIAAGTLKHGVYWKDLSMIYYGDTTWNFIGLDSAEVYSVYPHKSGPLGWAIGAGLKPDSISPHFVYCSFQGGLFEPRDQGMSDSVAIFIHELDGFPDPSICGETYAAAGGALYRRNFADSSWIPIYTATPEGYLQTVKVREEYPGVVLTGGAEGFAGRLLLKSLDYGNTWEWLSPPGFVTDIDFDGSSANYIWVISGNLYHSMDGGISWAEVFNANNVTINEVLGEIEGPQIFIAGYENSPSKNAVLFHGDKWGVHWNPVIVEIPNPIIDIELNWHGNLEWLYFATPDSGIFRFVILEVGIDPLRNEVILVNFKLFQNYPNPFNPETVISWQLAMGGEVELKIFNLLGQEVRTLVDEWEEAGSHSIVWDGFNNEGFPAASGIYICKLKSGNFSKVNKLILSR